MYAAPWVAVSEYGWGRYGVTSTFEVLGDDCYVLTELKSEPASRLDERLHIYL